MIIFFYRISAERILRLVNGNEVEVRQINGRRAFSTREASEDYFGGTPSVGTLRYWRHIGEGPKSFRLGRKLVMYFEEDLEAWLMDQYEESVTA